MIRYILFFLAVLSGSRSLLHAQDAITPSEFEKRMNAPGVQLLDVRTSKEFASGSLSKALQADWLNKAEFIERIKYLDKSRPVLVYCASGVRSGDAAKWMLQNGFSDVQNMKGGMMLWKQEGREVVGHDAKPTMSVDDYRAKITSEGLVLVDVGAEWCPPCRRMLPVIDQLKKEYPDKLQVVNVDGGVDIDIMKAAKATGLPTFILFKNGKEVWRKEGIVEMEEFRKIIR